MCRNGGQCIGEGVEEKCICKGGYGGPKCEGKGFPNFVVYFAIKVHAFY